MDALTASFDHHRDAERALERGDWTAAATGFTTAMQLRADGPAELREASRAAAEDAHACMVARAMTRPLDGLNATVHLRAAVNGAAGLRHRHGAPPGSAILSELRRLLARGAVPLPVIRGIYRQYAGLDAAVDELVGAGWLESDGATVRATDRCLPMLAELTGHVDLAAGEVLGTPGTELLDLVEDATSRARGSSPGPVFDLWLDRGIGADRDDQPAAVLFELLSALRWHRADAHLAACAAETTDAVAAGALPEDDPRRTRIRTATDRANAAAYRPLAASARQALHDRVRALGCG